MTAEIIHGDCLEAMRGRDADSDWGAIERAARAVVQAVYPLFREPADA